MKQSWKNKLTGPSPSPTAQSKFQIPKSQIQKGKGEFGLWAAIKILWTTHQPHPQLFSMKEASKSGSPSLI